MFFNKTFLLETVIMSIEFKKELDLAKKAAKKAGKFLLKNKILLNTELSSTNKDIKLQAEKRLNRDLSE